MTTVDNEFMGFDGLDREIREEQVVQPIVYEQTIKIKPNTQMRTGFKKIKVGVNDPCPCKSGKKFKKCCNSIDKAFNCLITNCKFCFSTIKSIDKEDYLNHVMSDREELIIQLNEYGAERQSLVLHETDSKKVDKLKAITQEEINRRVSVIQKVEDYLKKESVTMTQRDL